MPPFKYVGLVPGSAPNLPHHNWGYAEKNESAGAG